MLRGRLNARVVGAEPESQKLHFRGLMLFMLLGEALGRTSYHSVWEGNRLDKLPAQTLPDGEASGQLRATFRQGVTWDRPFRVVSGQSAIDYIQLAVVDDCRDP